MKGSLRESDSLKEPFTDFQRRKPRSPPRRQHRARPDEHRCSTPPTALPRRPHWATTHAASPTRPTTRPRASPTATRAPTALPSNLIGRRRHPRTQRDQPPKPPAHPTATREPNQPRATQPRPANPTSHAHPKRNARNQPATRTPQLQPAHPTSHPPPNRSQRTQRSRHPALPRTPIRSPSAVRGCLSRHLSRLDKHPRTVSTIKLRGAPRNQGAMSPPGDEPPRKNSNLRPLSNRLPQRTQLVQHPRDLPPPLLRTPLKQRLIQLPRPPSHLAKRSQPVIRQRQNLRPRIMRRRPPGNEPPILQPPAHISHRRRVQRDRLGQRGLIEPGISPHRRQHRELRPRQHRVDMPIPSRQIRLVQPSSPVPWRGSEIRRSLQAHPPPRPRAAFR